MPGIELRNAAATCLCVTLHPCAGLGGGGGGWINTAARRGATRRHLHRQLSDGRGTDRSWDLPTPNCATRDFPASLRRPLSAFRCPHAASMSGYSDDDSSLTVFLSPLEQIPGQDLKKVAFGAPQQLLISSCACVTCPVQGEQVGARYHGYGLIYGDCRHKQQISERKGKP